MFRNRIDFRRVFVTLGTLLALSYIFICPGCKSVSNVTPGHQETIVNYVDSVVIRDSVVEIPKETYYNVAWKYDSLHLETSLAEADCWVDSLWIRGVIKNKNNFTQHTTIQEHIIYKDSIVEKEIPVPYPVETIVEVKPWTFYMYRLFFWISLVGLAVFFGWKFLRKSLFYRN